MKKNSGRFKKIICATNIFEWYEFIIYSFLAVPIGETFFNSKTTNLAILNSLSVFALGYIVRPLGSIFFSYIGDKYHSSLALKYSMIVMAIPTAFIGILPGYKEIGLLAPFGLIILRLIQGFAAGGEFPSCASFLFESSRHSNNRSLICSMTNIGGMLGVLFASFSAFILYSIFSSTEISNGLWRILFILTIPLSIVMIRYRILIIHDDTNKLAPKIEIDKEINLLNKVIKSIILITFLQTGFYILFVWMPIYLENYLGMGHSYARMVNALSITALLFSTIIFSHLGKYVNYNYLILCSAIGTVAFSYPLFLLIGIKSRIVTIVALIIFVIIMGPIQGNYIYALCNEFKCRNKNKWIAISYTFPTSLFGGSAAYICSYFITSFGCIHFPGIYLSFFGILLILVMWFL